MIKDSGERKTFESGAVRDIHVGKGRFDLMPLTSLSELVDDDILGAIGRFQSTNDVEYLREAVDNFFEYFPNKYGAILELAKHFENGALKYGEHNWEKGIDESSYIDSASRHYVKFRAGWKDEDHASAFLWNILCLYHTVTVLKTK